MRSRVGALQTISIGASDSDAYKRIFRIFALTQNVLIFPLTNLFNPIILRGGQSWTPRGHLLMDDLVLREVQKVWSEISHYRAPAPLQVEAEIYKRLVDIVQPGDYYYMVFNPTELSLEYVSESVERVLGYKREEMTVEKNLSIIHPDDLPYFMDFEATVAKFCAELPPAKIPKYKSRYDYRVRKADGSYIRILQQIVAIQSDEQGAVLGSFIVHTDISHLKTSTKMSLSMIGLDGEPSYLDMNPVKKYIPSKELLTRREKEVLRLMAQGKTTAEIAEELYISPATVSTHRKNIHRKTETGTLLELVNLAVEKGWMM